jgi:hypothetical protein
VKNRGSVRPEDLRSLRAFAEDYPTAKRGLLYRGRQRLRVEGISCIPVEKFLSALRPGEDLPV